MTIAFTVEFLGQRLGDLAEVVPELWVLVLFGSAARDRTRSESDIDLAVQCDGPEDRRASCRERGQISVVAGSLKKKTRRAGALLRIAFESTRRPLFDVEAGRQAFHITPAGRR